MTISRFLRHAGVACMMIAGALAHSAAAADAPRGSLVIIGGALRADNAVVWQRVVDLAGGPGARIAVFASASAQPEESGRELVLRLNGYGADAFFVPIARNLPGTDAASAAMDADLADAVRSAGGAYFSGGDQARITQALLRADGSHSRVLDALWTMYRRGGVIAGSSAGAAIMSSTMFYEPRPTLAMLAQGVADGRDIAAGLGFIGTQVLVDQHMLVRGRFARMLPAMLAKGYRLGLGIDENTALVVGPQRDVEVLGYKGALLLDLTSAQGAITPSGLSLQNASISLLTPGDRFNLDSRAFTPSAGKAGGKLDPARPTPRAALFAADILGNSTVADLMEALIDSDQQRAIGLAFDGTRATAPSAGFEFRFSKAADSAGYCDGAGCAVLRLRLDVRPVEMALPLYRAHAGAP